MDALRHPMVSYVLDFCDVTLKKLDVIYEGNGISVEKIVEVVNYTTRDLKRISLDLSDKISRQKYAAYYGFWFAKLAPISGVTRKSPEGYEIVDINERIAVRLALDLLLNSIGVPEVPEDIKKLPEDDAIRVGSTKAPVPLVWEKCEKECSGICFKNGIRRYLSFHDYQNHEYIVHSLRHRGVGPYFLVGILESVVINSCEGKDLFQAV